MTLAGCLITGTDTGVGKTIVTAAIVAWRGDRCQRRAGQAGTALS